MLQFSVVEQSVCGASLKQSVPVTGAVHLCVNEHKGQKLSSGLSVWVE